MTMQEVSCLSDPIGGVAYRTCPTPAVTTERELALAYAMREFHTGESDGRSRVTSKVAAFNCLL
jgi:hypothetical protein